jgi:hypothetical protein
MNKQHVFLASALIIGAIVGSVVNNVIPNAQAAEGSYTHSSISCNDKYESDVRRSDFKTIFQATGTECFAVLLGEGVEPKVCSLNETMYNRCVGLSL